MHGTLDTVLSFGKTDTPANVEQEIQIEDNQLLAQIIFDQREAKLLSDQILGVISWETLTNTESHPLPPGTLIPSSPACLYSYRVIGPVCRLYDREELPYPSCALQWRGKQPSWKRVGKRFIPDIAAKGVPSYNVVLVDNQGNTEGDPFILSLFFLSEVSRGKGFNRFGNEWWYPNAKINLLWGLTPN